MSFGRDLWRLPQQLVYAGAIGTSNAWDTVALGRRLIEGFGGGVTLTWFRSPHLGYTAEFGLVGMESEASCAPVVPFHASGSGRNQVACTYVEGLHVPGSVVGLLGGVIYRFSTRGSQLYARAAAGGALLADSYVETSASLGGSTVFLLADPNRKGATWMLAFGLGAMLPAGPGFQVRFEARANVVALPRPTGPATDTGSIEIGRPPQPPIGSRLVLQPAFTVGLDVVLDKKRGHRY